MTPQNLESVKTKELLRYCCIFLIKSDIIIIVLSCEKINCYLRTASLDNLYMYADYFLEYMLQYIPYSSSTYEEKVDILQRTTIGFIINRCFKSLLTLEITRFIWKNKRPR